MQHLVYFGKPRIYTHYYRGYPLYASYEDIKVMPPTPEQIAEKFAREWLEAKPTAITNYTAVANQLAQRAIDAKATMIANWTAALQGDDSKWNINLGRYVGNSLMGDAYEDKLESITAITDAEKLKIQNSVTLKRHLDSLLDATLQLFKDAVAPNITVPAGITDVGLRQMLMSGINRFEIFLSTTSTAQAIYDEVSSYMNTHYGWPAAT